MWLGIAGALALPCAAQAACNGDWELPTDWWLQQDNGYSIEIVIANQVGNEYSGTAAVANVDGGRFKPFSATLQGNHLSMTITAAGGVYTGTIFDDGRIFGTTTNPNNGDTAGWHGDRPATCVVVKITPPPTPVPSSPVSPLEQSGVLQKPGEKAGAILKQTTPAQPPAAGGGAEYATAITPATIYVEPGGMAFKDANGDDIGMPVGSKALVLEKRTNPIWYKLQTKPVGWVWGKDVTLGP
jgi:hypothetical protein